MAGGAPAAKVAGAHGLLEAQLASGLGVDKIDRARSTVAPVKGALGATQDLHSFQLGQVSQQAAGTRRVHAVVIQTHRGVLGDHHRIGVAYTADEQRQIIAGGRVGGHLQAGGGHANVLGIDQAHGFNRLGVVGINRYRHVLQRLGASLRSNDDFFQLGIGVAGQQATGQQYRQGQVFAVVKSRHRSALRLLSVCQPCGLSPQAGGRIFPAIKYTSSGHLLKVKYSH